MDESLPSRNNKNFRFVTRNRDGKFVHSIALNIATCDVYVRTTRDGAWEYLGPFHLEDVKAALFFYEGGGFELQRKRLRELELAKGRSKKISARDLLMDKFV